LVVEYVLGYIEIQSPHGTIYFSSGTKFNASSTSNSSKLTVSKSVPQIPRWTSYSIEIATADAPNASTLSSATIQLFGSRGNSDNHIVEGTEGFKRGSVVKSIFCGENLGELQHLVLTRQNSDNDTNTSMGWFVDHIIIKELGNSGQERSWVRSTLFSTLHTSSSILMPSFVSN
jgi:hypothetical protein